MDDLKEMNRNAKAIIMDTLRQKYKKQIESQNNKLDREKKFADSLGEGDDPVQKAIEQHKERVKNQDLVKIQVDRKTCIYVPREKCVQDQDGKWMKKQK